MPYSGILNAISVGMKPLPKLLLALTAVAALSVAYPAKANLIQNGGFEDGFLNGWTNNGAGTNSIAHSGNWCADLVALFNASISQSVATTPGTTYTIDFFVLAQGGNTLNVTFGGVTIYSHLFSQQTDYFEVTVNVTASSANTNLEFSSSGVRHIFLDDVSVEPTGVGVPDGGTTVSLLGCALLGLAGLRRRLGC